MIAWISNPYAALLLVLPLNFWLLSPSATRGCAAAWRWRSSPRASCRSCSSSAVYASDLSMSLREVPWFWLLAVAGGQISDPGGAAAGASAPAPRRRAVLLALRPAPTTASGR